MMNKDESYQRIAYLHNGDMVAQDGGFIQSCFNGVKSPACM